jgi:NHL repeat.
VDKRGKEDIFYVGEYFSGIASNDTGTDLGPRISIFNKSGKLLSRLGKESYGPSVGRFYSPHGICVDSEGNIYVAEVSYSDYGQFLNPKRELRSMQKLVKTN